MKVSKESKRTARKLMDATVGGSGAVDMLVVRKVLATLVEKQPRGYLQIINAYHRMVRMELEQNHALIESAEPLAAPMQKTLVADLQKKYGPQLTTEFKTDPTLLGGMRVKVGSDVLDGSVRARLQRLQNAF